MAGTCVTEFNNANCTPSVFGIIGNTLSDWIDLEDINVQISNISWPNSSCSSFDSSPSPSPPSVEDTNHSPTLPPVVPSLDDEYTLVDLGHDNVERFFKYHVAPAKKPQRKTMGSRKLWQFLLDLLCDPATNPAVVEWRDVQNGVFAFTNSRQAASLWGQRRGHPDMTYEHMSRAIRHYYSSRVLNRVKEGKRLIYQFGPNAPNWKQKVKTASIGSLQTSLPNDFGVDATLLQSDLEMMDFDAFDTLLNNNVREMMRDGMGNVVPDDHTIRKPNLFPVKDEPLDPLPAHVTCFCSNMDVCVLCDHVFGPGDSLEQVVPNGPELPLYYASGLSGSITSHTGYS